MATITNYNNEQFSQVSNDALIGVTLVYRSGKTEVRTTATNLGGEEFIPKNGTADEIFRVWKNVIKTFWTFKGLEAGLKVDNGGIATKLKKSTPSEIIIRKADGKAVLRWVAEDSIFSKVGIIPTKKDLDEVVRDYKKKMHKAAKASFIALKTKFKFEDEKEATEVVSDAPKTEEAAA